MPLIRLAAAAMLLLNASPLRAQNAARLTGCVVDASSLPLPGVTVIAWATTREFTAVTDEHGCYVLDPLPADRYTVVAQLQGFNTATREVRVESGANQQLNLWLKIGSICECLTGPETLRELWQRSVAIVHVRIERNITGSSDVTLSAGAIEVFKRHPAGVPVGDRLTFLIRLSAMAQPDSRPNLYPTGSEFLMFFPDWDPDSQLFRLFEPGPWAVPIDRGRGVAVLFGKEVAFNTLLAQLRAWAADTR